MERRNGRTGETEGLTPALAPADLIDCLERIRERVHHWIDRFEGQLDDGGHQTTPDAGLEKAARELDEGWEALRAETERRDRIWADRLEALEHDRRLLADAWERLEREQLSAIPSVSGSPESTAKGTSAVPRATPAANEPENPLDRAILQQFETLRRDVRRTSEARNRR